MYSSFVQKLRPLKLSWLVWIATMTVVYLLWLDVGSRGPILGFGEGVEYKMTPMYPGRIQSIHVEAGQEVVAGQLVATIDPR